MGRREFIDGEVKINAVETEVIGDTAGMTDEEFGKARVGIGGSAVSTILGYSAFATGTEEYYRQIGQPLKRPISGKEKENQDITFASGHLLEDSVAKMAQMYFKVYKHINLKMINDTRMFRSKKFPWATANLDRWGVITHEDGTTEVVLIEIKTTSLQNKHGIAEWKAGIVPRYYEVQVRHYMAVMDVDHAYICCAWGQKVDDNSMAVIRIDRDPEIEKIIMEAEANFWDCVQMRVPPDTGDENQVLLEKFYARLYGEPNKDLPPVQLMGAHAEVAERIIEIDDEIKRLEEKKKQLEASKAEICNLIIGCFVDPKTGDQLSSYGSYYDEEKHKLVKISLGISKKRGGIDVERLLTDAPDVVKAVGKVSVTADSLKQYDKLHETHYSRDYKIKNREVTDAPVLNWKVTVKDDVYFV